MTVLFGPDLSPHALVLVGRLHDQAAWHWLVSPPAKESRISLGRIDSSSGIFQHFLFVGVGPSLAHERERPVRVLLRLLG